MLHAFLWILGLSVLVEKIVREGYEDIMPRSHGKDSALQRATQFDALMSGEVKDFGGDHDAGSQSGAITWSPSFGGESSNCGLDVLDDIERDFA